MKLKKRREFTSY